MLLSQGILEYLFMRGGEGENGFFFIFEKEKSKGEKGRWWVKSKRNKWDFFLKEKIIKKRFTVLHLGRIASIFWIGFQTRVLCFFSILFLFRFFFICLRRCFTSLCSFFNMLHLFGILR